MNDAMYTHQLALFCNKLLVPTFLLVIAHALMLLICLINLRVQMPLHPVVIKSRSSIEPEQNGIIMEECYISFLTLLSVTGTPAFCDE